VKLGRDFLASSRFLLYFIAFHTHHPHLLDNTFFGFPHSWVIFTVAQLMVVSELPEYGIFHFLLNSKGKKRRFINISRRVL
jgi:hypothetical protein